jgi:hypothetical protein
MAKGKRALSVQQVAALTDNGTHRVDNQLYLQIREQGTRSWVFRYSHNGRAETAIPPAALKAAVPLPAPFQSLG